MGHSLGGRLITGTLLNSYFGGVPDRSANVALFNNLGLSAESAGLFVDGKGSGGKPMEAVGPDSPVAARTAQRELAPTSEPSSSGAAVPAKKAARHDASEAEPKAAASTAASSKRTRAHRL